MRDHLLRALLRLALVALAAALPACSGSRSGGGGPVPPGVSALAPASGTVSTLVLVTGTGFGAAPSVTFSSAGHDYVAALTTVSDTRVEARVPSVDPSLAASGVRFDVTIRTAAGGAATLPGAFTMARPVVADVNGGLVGSGATGSPFIVDGAAFGDPTALGSTFAVEFCDTTGNAFPAAVSAEAWTNGFVVGTVPNGLGAGRRYDVKVTTPSGTSAPRPFLVLGGVTFSPSNIGWSTAPALPAPVQGLAAVVVPIIDPGGATTSYVFTLGGNGSTVAADDRAANTTRVAVNELVDAPTSVTGPFAWAAWREATPLPEARAWAAAVAAGPGNSVVASAGEVYVLGGLDPAGAATSGVYRATAAPDGTLGAWSSTTPLPAARSGHGAVVFHGRVYVAGGSGADGQPAGDVWSAKVLPDGTLGAWTALPALPAPVAFHQLVSYAGYLFVLGGTPQRSDPVASTLDPALNDTIWSAELDLRDGSLVEAATSTVWVDVGPLSPKPREKFTAVVAGSYLLLTGGLYSGAPLSTEESYAAFQTGALLGTIGSFSGATGSHTIYKASGAAAEVPYGHAAVPFVDAAGNAHVIVLGGGDVSAGAPHAEVWFQY